MSSIHRVRQGEYLANIARQYGFADYRTIYDHPTNAKFKHERPDPNVIYEGDEIVIPDKSRKDESGATETLHRFRLATASVRIRMLLSDVEHHSLRNRRYTLVLGNHVYEGATDDNGVVDELLSADASEGKLTVWEGDPPVPRYCWHILIAHLDPVESVTGVQARLNNLGFDCGPVDGMVGPRTKNAIRAFQTAHPPLEVDGICGPRTQEKLRDIYGC